MEVNTWKFPSPLRNLLMQQNAILIQYAVEVKTITTLEGTSFKVPHMIDIHKNFCPSVDLSLALV